MAVANSSFDAIASTTLKNYRKKFADNVTNGNVLSRYFNMKGKMVTSGGDTIVEELMYAVGNGGSYSEADTMTVTKPEGMSAAEFNWKQEYATITLTGTDELRNSGPERLQSLLEARTKQAEATMANRLGALIYGDGTGNGGKDILGLAAICSTTPTVGVLGGIDRASWSFWRNKVNASVGSFATNGLTAMGSMVRQLTRGMDRPTVIVTGDTVWGYLEALAYGKAQFNNPQLADVGFHALKFEGIDVVYDPQCTADRMFFLNLNYLKLRVHKDRDYKTTDFVTPADQDLKVAKILWAGQLVPSNCALQGVLAGFSA